MVSIIHHLWNGTEYDDVMTFKDPSGRHDGMYDYVDIYEAILILVIE